MAKSTKSTIPSTVTKIYPKKAVDNGGMKFFFNFNGKHYTMRFAGNPIILMEYEYKRLGGIDFKETLEKAKKGILTEQGVLLQKAVSNVSAMQELIAYTFDHGKSPFVIYANDFTESKI